VDNILPSILKALSSLELHFSIARYFTEYRPQSTYKYCCVVQRNIQGDMVLNAFLEYLESLWHCGLVTQISYCYWLLWSNCPGEYLCYHRLEGQT
jgi:hypothetical protein